MVAEKTGAEEILWDLTDTFSGIDDPQLTADIDSALERAKAFNKQYHGKVSTLDASALLEAVVEYEEISALIARAGEFAYMLFSTDTADPARGALMQKIDERGAVIQTETLFFGIEWLAVDDGIAERLLAAPVLDTYRHFLEQIRLYRPYTLSEAEEKIFTEKKLTGSNAWSRYFTEVSSARRVNIDGEDLAFEAAFAKLQLPDREVRRSVANAITDSLQADSRTLTYVFNTMMLDKAVDDRLRGYPSWISSMNLANEATDTSVQALIEAVVDRYDIPQRYFRLKAKLLGLERLAYYDRSAPLTPEVVHTPWAEARDIILKAYHSFSPEVGKRIEEFFDKRWIDAAVTPNKSGGAYCMTTVPGVHPYVFMNYTADRRSVLTLAHELGHALHGSFASEQTFVNAQGTLTLAETASVMGEALTYGSLLGAEGDPSRRLDLLAGRLEDAIGTVFRQITLNRFEDAIHTARREQGELTTEAYSDHWMRTQTEQFGDAVDPAGYDLWWGYIGHFIQVPGYVYAYAFGYLFSLAIYQKYLDDRDAMVEPYIQLLKAGGSDSPERLAKIVGIDLSDPNFWAGGLEVVDSVLKEAEDLAAQIHG